MSLLPAFGAVGGVSNTGPNFAPTHRSMLFSSVYGTKRWQIVTYYDPDLYVIMAKRVHPNGEWTCFKYDGTGGLPLLQLAAYDESHFTVACAIDSDGYVHMTWNGNREWNDVNLQYRRSTVTIDQWAGELTANLVMTGYSGEGNLNYPTFFKDPNGVLYYTYRDGVSYSADHILNRYNTSTETWSGVGATNGRIINGKTNDSVYMSGVPVFSSDWNGAGTGRMWITWSWRYDDVTEGWFDVPLMYWTGSAWKKPDTTAQTSPATVANTTVVYEADYREQARWILTGVRDMACSPDGTEVLITFGRREYGVGDVNVDTYTAVAVDDGVVTTADTGPQYRVHTFWDEKAATFRSVGMRFGAMYLFTRTSGATFDAGTLMGNFFGDGVNPATSFGWNFIDRELLADTGRVQCMKFPINALSVTPEVVEIGAPYLKDLPQMDFGGNTFTPSLRYNGGAATLTTFRAR